MKADEPSALGTCETNFAKRKGVVRTSGQRVSPRAVACRVDLSRRSSAKTEAKRRLEDGREQGVQFGYDPALRVQIKMVFQAISRTQQSTKTKPHTLDGNAFLPLTAHANG
jgi:hypothetical protein